MASNAFAGVGTVFARWDGTSSGSGAYDALAEVNSIQGPGMSRDVIDVTSLDSTLGYREFIGGFRDGENVTLEMNMTYTNYDLMLTDYQASTTNSYRITLSDTNGTQLDFSGFVVNMPLSVTPDDKVTISVTIKVTGVVSLSS